MIGVEYMQACGLIVEYNPLHNGHIYHIQSAKKLSEADCVIAIMSGSFLQRGEPGIIDKFHRAKAALMSGVDIVLELPYAYAVQHSDLFAYGAIHILNEIGVNTICFGSESGDISHFISSYHKFKEKKTKYENILSDELAKGISFPRASERAFTQIGLVTDLNLTKPNNILGFSYVKTILDNKLNINPFTIKRMKSQYHEDVITSSIASATSLRKELHHNTHHISQSVYNAVPAHTIKQLQLYKKQSQLWHQWELYFPLLQYRVLTMTITELSHIHDIDEGLENRIKDTAKHATSFNDWMRRIKTKRYTWTRLQRILTHILTNTTKADMNQVITNKIPYVRMLGFSKQGQDYLNQHKKQMNVPLITNLHRHPSHLLALEEKATYAYYSVLNPQKRLSLLNQELQPPIQLHI